MNEDDAATKLGQKSKAILSILEEDDITETEDPPIVDCTNIEVTKEAEKKLRASVRGFKGSFRR